MTADESVWSRWQTAKNPQEALDDAGNTVESLRNSQPRAYINPVVPEGSVIGERILFRESEEEFTCTGLR